MRFYTLAFSFVLCVLVIPSCLTRLAHHSQPNQHYKVTKYACGAEVKTWVSWGKVARTYNKNVFQFRDAHTNQDVWITGDFTVELMQETNKTE